MQHDHFKITNSCPVRLILDISWIINHEYFQIFVTLHVKEAEKWNSVCQAGLTVQICASHKFKKLIEKDDWDGKLQHDHPLLHVQVSELEDHL